MIAMPDSKPITTKVTFQRPTRLRFTPPAWAKLLFRRDAGASEIGGFGVAAGDDLLAVEDVWLVDQVASVVHVEFDDASGADYFDAQVDAGRRPEQFARIWIHTHPGQSAQPSRTDEQTFARVFGGANWVLMFILARGGQTYARLCYNVGPGSDVLVGVEVDYAREFAGSDVACWQQEYAAHVRIPPPPKPRLSRRGRAAAMLDAEPHEDNFVTQPPVDWYEDWYDYTRTGDSSQETDHDDFRDF